MINENTSPEERLFKVIQQGKQAALNSDNIAPKKGRGEWITALKRAILIWKERLILGNKGSAGKTGFTFPWKLHEVQLRTINVTLAILLLLFILFGAYYGVSKYPNIAKIVSASIKAQSSLVSANKVIEQMHPLSYYTEDAKERDIFSATESRGALTSGQESAPAAKSPAGDLKLQGIAWSDEPKVMIENSKDNKMYILKQGQVIGTTSIKVKTILRNKVILTYGAVDFEL